MNKKHVIGVTIVALFAAATYALPYLTSSAAAPIPHHNHSPTSQDPVPSTAHKVSRSSQSQHAKSATKITDHTHKNKNKQ